MARGTSRRARARGLFELEPLDGRVLLSSVIAPAASPLTPPRVVENLGRGVVAVRATTTQVFISWRLLALDPATIAFNVYRSANGAAPVKLTPAPLTGGTNFTDTGANLTLNNTYTVRPVINGVEQPASGPFTLKANNAVEPIVRVPLQTPAEGYYTKFIWVGDLDGDGEYDFVIDRLAPFDPTNNDIGLGNQFLEAYKRDGTRLWSIDMGINSRNTYNIEPGSSTLSMGMYDGVTVFDLNGDGRAEVILKAANGVTFADGTTLTTTNNIRQFMTVVDGMTGKMLSSIEFPSDYTAAGSYGTQLGIAYLNGVTPSIVGWLRNRNDNKSFNDIIVTWDWDGTRLTQKWKHLLGAGTADAQGISGFHQMRIADVDLDGKDEMTFGNYMLNADGSIRWKLAGIAHGDRYHIGKFDPNRPGLQGYGIQQNDGKLGQPNAILEYYYDASTGEILWTHLGTGADVGRGAAGDVDPTIPGYEMWSFSGMYNGPTNTLLDNGDGVPWPNFRIWWDGDLLSEELDGTVINKYNYQTNTTGRLVTGYKFGATPAGTWPNYYGDILGDWREEVIYTNTTFSELLIFSTNVPTSTRLVTLPQDAEYRACMTIKGYNQSHQVDFYLGQGMTTPAAPNVIYAGTQPKTVDLYYQAENAARGIGVLIESNYSGYNGIGFANYPAAAALTWSNVDGGDGGFVTLRFRYALGNATARTGRVTVNGVPQNLTFESTGAWGTWAVVSVVAPLSPGRTNTVVLESTGQDLANIDELQVAAIVPGAPTIQDMSINDGPTQRSMVNQITLTFSTVVTLAAGALGLTQRVPGGTPLAIPFTAANPSGDGKTYQLTFTGGSLTDGIYDLDIAGAAVTNIGGLPMAGNQAFTFHRQFGDFNGDGIVNNTDYFWFSKTFGRITGDTAFLPVFDYNGDGVINNADYFQFSKRYGTSIGS